jgi:D-alanyl-lipoteichoic acid acyltransferase DltB (MBOAT superfamily)
MCWKAEYLILILVSTLIDYVAGIQMGKTEAKSERRKYLILSLFTNLGLLFAFKYFNFFNESARQIFDYFNIFYNVPSFNVLLPVGISFYTFQTLSYTIDVYRGEKKPERHFGIFALYVAFFPQLVAGPIERSTRLLPQFYQNHHFQYDRITDGLKLMLWGFFKKVVIADRLAILVNQVYNSPHDYTGFPLIIATYFFAFQIYCDFSGYSDIAIGAAQVMGYDLMENFNRPYFSKSISEFWKRWHISLSTWFRDYLYIPLGGNRVGKWRWYFNLFIVFLISGLWHGANWTFVVWGALHGFYLIASIITQKYRDKLSNLSGLEHFPKFQKHLRVFITFHLVTFSWIFFRANSISDAFYITKHLFVNFQIKWIDLGLTRNGFLVAIASILFMEFIHLIQRRSRIRHMLRRKPLYIRLPIYIIIAASILLFGIFRSNEFIYFQF